MEGVCYTTSYVKGIMLQIEMLTNVYPISFQGNLCAVASLVTILA